MSAPGQHETTEHGTHAAHVHVAGSGCCTGEASAMGVVEQIKHAAETQKKGALEHGYAKASHLQEAAQCASEQIEKRKEAMHQQVERGAQVEQDVTAKKLSGMQEKAIHDAEKRTREMEQQKQEAISGVEKQAQASAQRVAAVEEREREKLQHVAQSKLHDAQQSAEEREKPTLMEKIKTTLGLGEEESKTRGTGTSLGEGSGAGVGSGVSSGVGSGSISTEAKPKATETIFSKSTLEHETPNRSM